MWVISQEKQVINIDLFKMVAIENGQLIVRNGREYYVVFKGEPEICEELYYKIIDGLTMGISLLDLKIIN